MKTSTRTATFVRAAALAAAAVSTRKMSDLWFDKDGHVHAEKAVHEWSGGLKERRPWEKLFTDTFCAAWTAERERRLEVGKHWGVSDLGSLIRLWTRTPQHLAMLRRYGCRTMGDIETREAAIIRYEWQADAIQAQLDARSETSAAWQHLLDMPITPRHVMFNSYLEAREESREHARAVNESLTF